MVEMRIGIIAKTALGEAVEIARELIGRLGEERVVSGPELSVSLGRSFNQEEFERAEVLVAIGGDGTVLRAHRLAHGRPVLGINVGERGFLAEAHPRELQAVVDRLVSKNLEIFETLKLAVQKGDRRLPDGVNDVSVLSEKGGKTISVEVEIDGAMVFRSRGNGVVVSSPTGSTGYSRSAGGPVLDPEVQAIAVTPVCPSDPRSPKLVVPSQREIEIKVVEPGEAATVVVDGYQEARLQIGESVKIWKSETPARLVCWKDFYSKLGEKLL